MTGQYVGERFDNANAADGSDKYTNSPLVNSDPFANDGQEEEGEYNEKPIDEVEDKEDSENEPSSDEQSMENTTAGVIEPVDEAVVPVAAPVQEWPSHETIYTPTSASATLLESEDTSNLRAQWSEIQGKFVDDPRSAVQEADALVTKVVDQITQKFASEHASLESQWKQGNDVSTEDLRKALQHYRTFFNRLMV